jgi:hypothetical protein
MIAAHQIPLDHESCTTAASTRSWELHTSVLPIMRAAQQQRPLDRESCTPASSRLWELYNISVHSIVRAAHQRPPDYESCTTAASTRSWELHTSVLPIMRAAVQRRDFLSLFALESTYCALCDWPCCHVVDTTYTTLYYTELKWTYFEIPTNLTLQLFWMISSSGLRGRRRTYLTILKRAWPADSKMVSYPVTSEAGARGHSKINVRVRLWESRSTPTLGCSERSLQCDKFYYIKSESGG